MSDIVDRLKALPAGPYIDWSIRGVAAAHIEAVEAENVRLRNQLDAARTGKALQALEAAQEELSALRHYCRDIRDTALEVHAPDHTVDASTMLRQIAAQRDAERNLCDQLAEALRALYEHGDATRYTIYTDSIVRFNGAKAALAAYEAARKEGA